MEYKTYAQIKTIVEERIDTEDETFISDNELLRYCQEAVDYCEDKIHTLGAADRYFETVAPLALVSGRSDYQMPANIYGNKILRILLNRSNDIYEIKRLTHSDRYRDIAYINQFYSPDNLYYFILNNDPNVKPVIRLTPRPNLTVATYSPTLTTISGSADATVSSASGLALGDFISATGVPTNTIVEAINGTTVTMSAAATASGAVSSVFTKPDVLIYYIRNANKPTSDSSIIDVPEFSHFIVQYMIVECLKKDSGNPRLGDELQKLSVLEENMVSTLSEMVPDQDTRLEVDNSFEMEMS